MIKNTILILLSVIFLVTAGSLTYVFYYNTKAQIIEDREKKLAEMPSPKELREQKEREKKEKQAKKEKAAKVQEQNKRPSAENIAPDDVAHLVQDMYVTPISASSRAYEYEEHDGDAGIFLHPYVIEKKGTASTLHLKAGYRGQSAMNFDDLTVKCDSGEKHLKFTPGANVVNKAGLVVTSYDVQATGDIESIMHAIAASNYVQVLITGKEDENKILSPAEIKQFKNVVLLFDALNDGK